MAKILSRLLFFTSLFFLVFTACKSSGSNGTGKATEIEWWDDAYAQRMEISLENTGASTAAAGYSVSFSFDHSSLVTATESLSSGNDVRVVHYDGENYTELDRVVAPDSSWNAADTTIIFPIANEMTASALDEESYFVYFNNAEAGSPPADYATALSSNAGWSRQTENSSYTLGARRRAEAFYSVQLRQLDTTSYDYEIYVRDGTYDSGAFGEIIITDNNNSDALLYSGTFGNYGDFDTPGFHNTTVTISSNNIKISIESGEASASRQYFGDERYSYNGSENAGNESDTTVRNYTRTTPAASLIEATLLEVVAK